IDLPIPEMYDLDADPGEAANLFAKDATQARTLESLLRDVRSTLDARAAGAGKNAPSADAPPRVPAPGYTASSAAPPHRKYTDDDDPKTLVPAANALNDALARFRAGAGSDAIDAVRRIAAQHPQFSTPYGVLASMLHDAGHLDDAIAALEDAVRRGIADQSTFVVLAGYFVEAREPQRAVDILEPVIASHPDYADAHNSLGVALSRLDRHDRARA